MLIFLFQCWIVCCQSWIDVFQAMQKLSCNECKESQYFHRHVKAFLDYQALTEMALRYQICHDGLVHEIPLVKRLAGNNCKTISYTNLPIQTSIHLSLSVISLTLPVSTASCKRSFTKMKLLKTFLRNSMCNDCLSQLAFLSIESNRAELIGQEQFVDEFDSRLDC